MAEYALRRTLTVICAIDLDDQRQLGRQRVDDEPPEQRHLPAKRRTELRRPQRLEQARFRRRGRAPHLGSTLGKHTLAMGAGT